MVVDTDYNAADSMYSHVFPTQCDSIVDPVHQLRIPQWTSYLIRIRHDESLHRGHSDLTDYTTYRSRFL